MTVLGCLAGVKVIDFTDDSGRFATKLLTEMGADVVRISSQGSPGQPLRDPAATELGGVLDWWYDGGKRRHTIDITTAAGQDAYRQLALQADIVVETQPPGVLAEHGVDYDDLVADRASDQANDQAAPLVQVSLTPFGRTGPRAHWATSDLVSAAMGGMLSLTGTPDRPLTVWGWQAFNYAGYLAATCALSGLLAARRTGKGAHVDLSIHEAVCGSLENLMMQYVFDDHLPIPAIAQRQGALHWMRLYDVTACRTGHLMYTPTPSPELLFEWMAETGSEEVRKWIGIEVPELLEVVDEIMAAIRGWLKQFDADPLWWEAQSRHIAFGAVLDVAEVCANPQFEHRGFFAEAQAADQSAAVKLPWRLVRWSDQGNAGAVPPQPPTASTNNQGLEQVLASWQGGASVATVPFAGAASASTAEASATAARPLDGVRIADFTWVLAGPSATKMLGDLGADVVRVQSEEHATLVNHPEHPYYFTWNRSKRSALLNMSHPQALDAARRLLEQCDVLIENFSAGVLDSWGLDWETVHEWNPRLVYVSMSGCGHDGPWQHVISYAPTVHAVCGITHLTNFDETQNIGPGFSLNDHLAGYAAAVSTTAALAARDRTGKGQRIDMAQLEVGSYAVAPALIQQLAGTDAPRPGGNADAMAGNVPNEVFRCADEAFVAITATNDQQWQALVETITATDGSPDAAFLCGAELAMQAGRAAHVSKINEALSSWAANCSANQAAETLQSAGVPAGVVQNAADLLHNDPQHAARQFWQEIDHGVFGPRTIDAFAARWDSARWQPRHLSPTYLGEHNFDVWTDWAGYEFEEVAELMGDGLFS